MPLGQLHVSCHEVCVRVGQDDPSDVESELLGVSLVVGDVPLGINDSGLIARTDEVGELGEAAELVLTQDEVAVALLERDLRGRGPDAVGGAFIPADIPTSCGPLRLGLRTRRLAVPTGGRRRPR